MPCKVVGAIDQMEVDDADNAEKNSGSAPDSEKGKSKRKLYVGSQSLGFRRDNMEVGKCPSYFKASFCVIRFFTIFEFLSNLGWIIST